MFVIVGLGYTRDGRVKDGTKATLGIGPVSYTVWPTF